MTSQTQQHSAWLAAHHAELTAGDLWLHYFSIGGYLTEFELDAYLHGMFPIPQGEGNTVALALNELIDDLPRRPRAHYVVGPPPDQHRPAAPSSRSPDDD
ncbi:hypothetical protein [Arthrobacter antioxidans]|uniref:hypothetical protein n=1 Tax=Arthrobacter antioxidans TaxID=2895818 RepID=UPI001FFE891D|nr:hypothetical protein [Arthrobacter antioxidans]